MIVPVLYVTLLSLSQTLVLPRLQKESPENSSRRNNVTIFRIQNKTTVLDPGVNNIDIDLRQHKVVVTGNVNSETLIRRLTKAGKHAELWPESKAKELTKLLLKRHPKTAMKQMKVRDHPIKNNKVMFNLNQMEHNKGKLKVIMEIDAVINLPTLAGQTKPNKVKSIPF